MCAARRASRDARGGAVPLGRGRRRPLRRRDASRARGNAAAPVTIVQPTVGLSRARAVRRAVDARCARSGAHRPGSRPPQVAAPSTRPQRSLPRHPPFSSRCLSAPAANTCPSCKLDLIELHPSVRSVFASAVRSLCEVSRVTSLRVNTYIHTLSHCTYLH